MSRTRTPANGNVDVSEFVVASPRYRPLDLQPLIHREPRNGLVTAWIALGAAMMSLTGVQIGRGRM